MADLTISIDAPNFPGVTATPQEVLLYLDTKGTWQPFQRVRVNETVAVPTGTYLAVTPCSSYKFNHTLNKTKLSMGQVQFQKSITDQTPAPPSLLPVACHEAITNERHTFYDRWAFDILPGPNTLYVGGQALEVVISEEEPQLLTYTLMPVTFTVPENLQTDSFFEIFLTNEKSPQEINQGQGSVQAVAIPAQVWLLPRIYQAEISGTTQTLDLRHPAAPVTSGEEPLTDAATAPLTSVDTTSVPAAPPSPVVVLSALRVETPPHFPFELRADRGGEPLFVQLNNQTPLSYNTTYPLFAGPQTLALQASSLVQPVNLLPNEITVIRTTGVLVEAPVGSGAQVGIHEPQKTFSLLVEQAGLPFTIFQGSYEYSVEGLPGLNKSIQNMACTGDGFCKDSLAKVNLTWQEIDTPEDMKTDFVRFEATGGGVVGKTVDLFLFTPGTLFLPRGTYTLSYLLKNSSGRRVLQQVNSTVNAMGTGDISLIIPIYQQINPQDKTTPPHQLPDSSGDQDDNSLQPIY